VRLVLVIVLLYFYSYSTHAREFHYNPALSKLRDRLSGPIAGAHQGGFFSGHFPNTLKAFQSAFEAHAEVVEMDLHLTRDGIVIIYHDNDLKTWTNCKGLVHEKTYAEIKKCHLIEKNHFS